MKHYLAPFKNIKFNIALFAMIALASVAGTLIPQIPENPERVQEFMAAHPQWGWGLKAAGFFNIYYSWWYIGMLGLLAFNVVVCKLIFGKFPGFHTFKQAEKEALALQGQPFQKKWQEKLP